LCGWFIILSRLVVITAQVSFTFCSRVYPSPYNLTFQFEAIYIASMPSPLAYYLENYVPPSAKVTFKYGKTSFEWDPKYLAAISSVYSTIPQCAVFEINQRKTITTKRAATIFHRMLPMTEEWNTLPQGSNATEFDAMRRDKTEWNDTKKEAENVYQALELCNYLGIKASGQFFRPRYRDFGEQLIEEFILDIITDHQLFLVTRFEEGIKLCEYTFRRCYYPKTPSYKSHCKQTSNVCHNETVDGKFQAYLLFAEAVVDYFPNWMLEFLMERLHWKKENEMFGIRITLPDENDVLRQLSDHDELDEGSDESEEEE